MHIWSQFYKAFLSACQLATFIKLVLYGKMMQRRGSQSFQLILVLVFLSSIKDNSLIYTQKIQVKSSYIGCVNLAIYTKNTG